ncbi:AfsR/SARP family transcriptional regulator [Streptomyces sp. NPDC021020]|uniref:AfsR/SARP family transcriptional regulator n=1 Tax=Streptomyces sp. NPDC021020 TaxID=3365109 RepID=UPI0037908781
MPLGPTKSRLLLAALLLRGNEIVPQSALVEAVWDDCPPPSAYANLRTYVRGLRQLLDPQGENRLRLLPGGYLLSLGPLERDSDRFSAVAGSGRDALAVGNLDAARAQFRQALDIPRGPQPLSDLPLTPTLLRQAAPLTEMVLAVEEDYAAVQLTLGAPADVVRRLRPLLDRHPLRQRAWAQMMLGLYRLGDVAGALDAFQRAQHAMRQELGLDPNPHMVAMHDDILHHRPHLDVPGRAAVEAAVTPPAESGAVRPQEQPDITAVHEPADMTVPHQLPRQLPDFRGRKRESALLDNLIDGGGTSVDRLPVCVISGMAGVGKTSLVLHWGHGVADRFPDGHLYADLRGYDPGHAVSPSEVLRSFLEALGVPRARVPLDGEGRSGLYRSLLSTRRMLVVLDNARDAEQVRPLLPGSGDSLAVITSRRRLIGLTLREGARQMVLDVMPTHDAYGVLASHAGADRLAAEPDVVDTIVSATGRLPLALAIVGARISSHPGFPLRVFAKELLAKSGPLDALDDGEVRQIFSWSYLALSAPAADLFLMLGLHPGQDITAAAAAALAATAEVDVVPALGELTRLHLLTEHRPGRYAFHDLLRAYAAELGTRRLTADVRRAALHRLLDHYLHQAYPAAVLLQPQWLTFAPATPLSAPTRRPPADASAAAQWFGSEQEVLTRVIHAAASSGFEQYAWQLAWALTTFLAPQGLWQRQQDLQRAALDAARRSGDCLGTATSLRLLARACTRLDELDEAEVLFGDARMLYQKLDDAAGEAQTLHNMVEVCFMQGRLDKAVEYGEDALLLHERAGGSSGEARTLNAIGWVHAAAGRYEKAVERCTQAMAQQRLSGDRNGLAATLDSLGFAYDRLGRSNESIRCFEEAIQLFRESADRYHEAETLIRLGDARLAANGPEAACADWAAAAAILDELADPLAQEAYSRLTGRG